MDLMRQIPSFECRKQTYATLLSPSEYTHLKVYHFKIPCETDAWLRSLQE